jgi:iron complex outermembrane receptor protein
MKKIMGTTAIMLLSLLITAQTSSNTFKGQVVEKGSGNPIVGATISIGNRQISSNDQGLFILPVPNPGSLTISSIGFENGSFTIPTNFDKLHIFELKAFQLFLQPLEVKAIRASDRSPFTKTNLNKSTINKLNLGTDIPFLLNQTTAVVVNADAGNGVGYTGIRIRGTDATRINVTLNGIPYNDAESMGTFFVNLPDFSSSVNSIQIQRGAGTSSNGASSFGATINMSTNEFNSKAYTEFNNSIGSFNTIKNTIKAGTGLIGNHFTLDARVSKITSDGFIDRASSDLKSFYISAAYLNKKSSLRLNVFSGKEKTYQAWYGVAENLLKTDRTNNPAGTEKAGSPYENQTDNYTQTHYQLFYNTAINDFWSFNTAFFLTKGNGYYEEYKADQRFSRYGLPNVVMAGNTITRTNLVRQRWLDNDFYGQIISLQYKKNKQEFTLGGGWSVYKGSHFGTIPFMEVGTVPNGYKYYDLPATKNDANIYAKWQYSIAKNISLFTDLQLRTVKHSMNGFSDNPTLNISRSFTFFNPKAGITYNKNNWSGYISYAIARKEPNRDDFQASQINQPTHETLHDWELGIEQKNSKYSLGLTAYYMKYTNQLVLTGAINDVGAYTRTNIPNSYRAGIEIQAAAAVKNWLNINGNISLSKNKIKAFTEYIDDYDNGGQLSFEHRNKDISFSPTLVAAMGINFTPIQQLELSLLNKWVSKQYLDNTQNEQRKLNGFYTQDLRAIYTIKNKIVKEAQLIFQLNNLYNKKYEPNGYTFSYFAGGGVITENFYYPMAGRNFMLALNIRI